MTPEEPRKSGGSSDLAVTIVLALAALATVAIIVGRLFGGGGGPC